MCKRFMFESMVLVLAMGLILGFGVLSCFAQKEGESTTIVKCSKELTDFVQSSKAMVSAIEAGINYQQYGDMVVKLKISGDLLLEALENYPKIQQRVENIVSYYIAARSFWEVKIFEKYSPCIEENGQIERVIARRYPKLQMYLNKYPFLIKEAGYYENFFGKEMHSLNLTTCCQILWEKAQEEISQIKVLIKQ